MSSRSTRLLLAALLLLASGCGRGNEAPSNLGESSSPVRLFAAVSASEPCEQLAQEFKRQLGIDVRLQLASSDVLARQIEQGAPADLFLSANTDWVDHLEKQGLVEQSIPLLSNRLVLVVPADNPSRIERVADLAEGRLDRLSLGDPDRVPAGIYAKKSLENLGLWDKVAKKVIGADSVRSALALVERGEVGAGIVYRTDIRGNAKIKVVAELPAQSHPPIIYPLARLKSPVKTPSDDRHAQESQRFYLFLGSPTGLTEFERFGFTLPSR